MRTMAQVLFEANTVVCPKCDHQFTNNRINGLALIETINHIDAQKRVYSKLALDTLQEQLNPEDFKLVRKVFLDRFNDWGRSIQTILGMGNEVE